jgi:phytoene dehydrogenase-like protein
VEFAPLDPDGFDTLVYPDFELRVPQGAEHYRERLLERFPAERRAIDANLKLIASANALLTPPTSLMAALRVAPDAAFVARHLSTTLSGFLHKNTRDPRLVAVLAGEGGDYALPPSRASLLLHGAMMAHYLSQGAFYPRGGGQVMSDRLAESIEKSGGKLLLSTLVKRILVERGEVRGVVIENKHLGRVTVRAPVVIANSDIKQTLLELLEPEALSRRTRERARSWQMAPALGIAYLGVRREALGSRTQNTNYWIYSSYDLERQYRRVAEGGFAEDPFAFISLASLKDPQNRRLAPEGIVNLQLMGLAPSSPAAWGVSEAEYASGEYRDSARYEETKARYERQLMAAAERVFPKLSQNVVFSEVATPLTHSRYTLSTGGTSYGLAATPAQTAFGRPGPKTEIKGLILCGASTVAGHGIMGTLMGGALAASTQLGFALLKEVFSQERASVLRQTQRYRVERPMRQDPIASETAFERREHAGDLGGAAGEADAIDLGRLNTGARHGVVEGAE